MEQVKFNATKVSLSLAFTREYMSVMPMGDVMD